TAPELLLGLGGETRGAPASDPIGRPIAAGYALVEDGGAAVVDVAEATGLPLLTPEERDPLTASSRGTGELLAAAARSGADVVLLACGGSATVDGGIGALGALDDAGVRFGERNGPTLVCLCDVRTPWEEAADRFGPQKGATVDTLPVLRRRMHAIAGGLPRDPRGRSGTGAAGGLSGALWAVHGARLEPGAAFVLDALGVRERAARSRAVIVGEGRLDPTTMEGKAASAVASEARRAGVPCIAIVGRDALDPAQARVLGIADVVAAGDPDAISAAAEEIAARLDAYR
ncbi:MAG: glycerate kinase, partial [Solirubrobacteraceae bacterium]